MVSLRILSPLLNPQLLEICTDPNLIRERAEAAIADQPERLEGMAIPMPINVLDNLRLYLTNALHHPGRSKAIAATNKRFMVSFGMEGEPCKDALEFLGFTYDKETGSWQPPQPDAQDDIPYQDPLSIFLDDAINELIVLILQRPASEKRGVHSPDLSKQAMHDILYALDAQDYPKSSRTSEFSMAPAPFVYPLCLNMVHDTNFLKLDRFYEDIGATEDMSASLIVEAYQRQVSVDPARGARYLQCLKAIGTLRGGEDWEIIDQAAQVAYSEGKYSEDDVAEAYKYFGLWQDDPNITEDSIIGKFYAFLSSTSQEKETESRQQLWRIGHSLGNERIKAVSEDRVSTAEQAQVFLGVEDNTPDDFIITMYTAKVNDNPSCKEMANRAVRLIAESRNSTGLSHFLDTGETIAGEMDIADAYRLLQIPDRTADDGAIMAAYTICIDENPDQAEIYNRALSIIAKEMESPMLRNMAGISSEPDRDLSEWPVGLQNIGNTCYLNSLLQFYFSVLPFRNMVLNLERYQMNLEDGNSIMEKKVGSRKVARKEVERSLKFLGELRGLFQNMISSSQSSVTPGQELARLTLISPGNEAAIRRRSTISKSQSLGDINGMPILGPLGPPQPIVEEQTQQEQAISDKEVVNDLNSSDLSSEGTLVSENDVNGPTAAPAEIEGINSRSPTNVSESDGGRQVGDTTISPPRPEAPNRPPPVPPRPLSDTDRQRQLIEEVEIGAQQDVTEVINNVLFQSQCAIKPRGIDSDGEQLDQIKDLFYGRTRSYISTQDGIRSKEERWCDIKVNVAGGSRDIYAAIDGAFDAQKISVENGEAEQYGAITHLPPVLQIQVQRVQFDPVKKSSFKSTHHLDLLQTIYLDRYMDTRQSDLVDRRRQCWEWKTTLKSLESRREELLRKQDGDNIDTAQLFRDTKTALEDISSIEDDDTLEVKPELLNELNQLSEMVDTELKFIDQEIESTQKMISNQFVGFQKLPYRLYAVFVHHGSVSFGHYWIYIYDFRKDIWRKYNDEYVTEVQNLDEIFKNTDTQNPPTPYFLVYLHDEIKDRLVDPVCRDIVDPMPDMNTMFTEVPTAMDVENADTMEDMEVDPPSYQEAASQGDTPDMIIPAADEKKAHLANLQDDATY
ncbi:hypothetical protein N7462_007924 [Penicillium macrosclerotiorum]|uniref:uncharacterized protein n=1 Tax=Penicillium macrosclerotiorum TaxID=303699 RepID=UPI00254795F3|nr:uncharacterized protein N7462_007924 [Penicillium macrosclerotiorum]KAJ5679680.1 hypothetical protein N7462_007924 [Penicillium macrosclerotiorum]